MQRYAHWLKGDSSGWNGKGPWGRIGPQPERHLEPGGSVDASVWSTPAQGPTRIFVVDEYGVRPGVSGQMPGAGQAKTGSRVGLGYELALDGVLRANGTGRVAPGGLTPVSHG